jgi:hypothetical protein
MDYVDDQIIDNLIRASHGLPIVQLDFSHIIAGASLKLTPQVGGGRTEMGVSNAAPNRQTVSSTTTAATGATTVVTNTIGAIGGLVTTITKPFTYSGSADSNTSMSVEANPVLNAPEIYAAYVRFLKGTRPILAPRVTRSTATSTGAGSFTLETSTPKEDLQLDFNNIQSLRRTAGPPPADAVISKRWRDYYYYWVPAAYRHDLFDLALATVMRSQPETDKPAKDIESALRQQQLFN